MRQIYEISLFFGLIKIKKCPPVNRVDKQNLT